MEELRDEEQYEDFMSVTLPSEHKFEVDSKGRKCWVLDEADIECMAIGAGILGAGGGGSPYLTKLVCRQVMREGFKFRIVAHEEV